jgi:hypothetical protein
VDFDGTETYSKVVSVVSGAKKGTYKIYPNPAADMLNIRFNGDKEQNADIELYDSLGKLVHHHNFVAKEGDNHLFFSTKAFAAGLYTLKIKQEGSVVSEKVVIQ